MCKSIAVLTVLLAAGLAEAAEKDPSVSAQRPPLKTTDWRLREVLAKAKPYDMQQVFQSSKGVRYLGQEASDGINSRHLFRATFGFGGAEMTDSVSRFLYLPRPVLVLADRYPVRGVFPTGAVVGEVLQMSRDGGSKTPWEIRTATKERDRWVRRIYRPFTKSDAAKYVESHRVMTDLGRSREVDQIRDMTDDEVEAMLDRPFVEVTGDNWSAAGGVFPPTYTLGVIDLEDHACNECHRHTLKRDRELLPNDFIVSRGYIRGMDGVFSWHPFDEANLKRFRDDPAEIKLIRAAEFSPTSDYQFARFE